MDTVCLPHSKIPFFSSLNIDYLAGDEKLSSFYDFRPDDNGLRSAIEKRKDFPVDRQGLVSALKEQYSGYDLPSSVENNISLLANENTFTICTAHQPNLMTGYLYFIYKILHTVRLSAHLKSVYPEYNFVPVYYIGSEDADLDELGTFRYNDIRYRWNTDQTGAVGKMQTQDLQPLLHQLASVLGPPGEHTENLKAILFDAYNGKNNIAQATRYLVNELMGNYGIVIIDSDNKTLKHLFSEIIQQELFNPISDSLVQTQSAKLNQHYTAQAFSRPINLFYLKDNIRERIERTADGFKVVHTSLHFTDEEMKTEAATYPERFSPNVILRGLFQETVLPNVAFIGGGSEVAYWLQLKPVFEHYRIFFPALILRQSFLISDEASNTLQAKLGLSDEAIFQPTEELVQQYVKQHAAHDLELNNLEKELQQTFEHIKDKATKIDATLRASADAALTKMKYQIQVIEKKMLRAEKRNMADNVARIYKLKNNLFPNSSLQERYDTFMSHYISEGSAFFEKILNATLPYGDRFVVIK